MQEIEVDVSDLSRVLFELYKAYDGDGQNPALWAQIARLKVVPFDDEEMFEAMYELRDMIEADRKKQH